MLGGCFYIIVIIAFVFLIITFCKLLFLLFKYLFYYISDIFGSQNPNHDLAYRVPLVPFCLPFYIFTFFLILLLTDPSKKEGLSVYLVSILYVVLYTIAMYRRYKKNIKRYDEIVKKNMDFIKTCLFPVSGFLTVLGFCLTATGITLNKLSNISLAIIKLETTIETVVVEKIQSEDFSDSLVLLIRLVFSMIFCLMACLPHLCIGYIFIRILHYIARNADDYKEFWASMKIWNKIVNVIKDKKFEGARVNIPFENNKISIKTFFRNRYVYYEIGKESYIYKKYNAPKKVCIGKGCDDDPKMMISNANFQLFSENILNDCIDFAHKS